MASAIKHCLKVRGISAEWNNNQENGQGMYTWLDKLKYIGEWKDGKKNGQGTMTWLDG